MGKHRKNHGPQKSAGIDGTTNQDHNAPWFDANVRRQRRRRHLANISRRANRGTK